MSSIADRLKALVIDTIQKQHPTDECRHACTRTFFELELEYPEYESEDMVTYVRDLIEEASAEPKAVLDSSGLEIIRYSISNQIFLFYKIVHSWKLKIMIGLEYNKAKNKAMAVIDITGCPYVLNGLGSISNFKKAMMTKYEADARSVSFEINNKLAYTIYYG